MSWHLLIIIGLLVIVGGVAGAALLIALLVGKRKSRTGGDEDKVIQDVHQGLERMEERAEALERTLLDRPEGTAETFGREEGRSSC